MFPLNLPNVLTLIRILLVPVLVVVLLDATPGGSWLAAGGFALAALTDGLGGDGDHRARVRGQRAARRGGTAGRRNTGEQARQGEDDHPGCRRVPADRGRRPEHLV